MKSMSRENAEARRQGRGEVCERCRGTGLVCGHTPVIAPGSCCVDYANALCPDCKGRGVKSEEGRDKGGMKEGATGAGEKGCFKTFQV